MTPEQAQRIRRALDNHQREARTLGAKILDALQHAKRKPCGQHSSANDVGCVEDSADTLYGKQE